MAITINRLHKILSEFIAAGHGRKVVCVNKDSFSHPLEQDGAVILEAHNFDVTWIGTVDDDGGQKMNKDGTESGRVVLVISGDRID